MDDFTDSSVEGHDISKTQKNVASENVQNPQKFINYVPQDGIGYFVSDQIDNKSSEWGERSNAVELLAAAGEGQVEVVKRILENNRDMIFVADPMGDTAFHLAVRAGHYDVVLEVIRIARMRDQLGRVMVEKNVDGDTVLELASKIGNSEVTECLDNEYVPVLLRESGMYMCNKDGKYPWEVVQQPGYKQLVSKEVYLEYMRNLEENPRGEEKTSCTLDNLCKHCSEMKLIQEVVGVWANLCWAIESNQEVMVLQILWEEPSLIQYSNEYQGAVLHVAIHSRNLSMIDLVVQYITNNHPNPSSELARLMSITDNSGQNPLDAAIEFRFILAAFYLTELAPQAMFQLNTWGFSPLHHAVKEGYCDLVSFMIDQAQASDASIKERLHSYAMEARLPHAAINTRYLGMLRVLLKKLPFLINSPNDKGWKPLSYVASKGYIEQVSFILGQFPNFVSKYDRDGSTPIHKAIAGGHIHIVKEFIEKFPQTLCDIDKEGRTTLHIAARYHKANILSYLLEQDGAKYILNLRDREGNTFHDLAKELRNRNSSSENAPNSESIPKYVDQDPNFVAKTTQTSNSGGGSINHQNGEISSDWEDSDKCAELLAAAREGRVDVVRRILDDRDMMLVGDSMGDTALHRATRAGHSEVVLELIRMAKVHDVSKRAMVDQNVDGDTALHLAIKNGHLQVARCLINECYSSRDVINKDGKEPYDLAKQYGYQDLVKMLSWSYCSGISDLEMEIVRRDLEKGDEDDVTTLYNLCKAIELNQEIVVLRNLREKPSLSKHIDIDQGSVFHVAAFDEKLGILRRLVDYITTNNRGSCNELARLISIKDSYGDNPLHIAIKCGQMSAALYLTEVAPQAMLQLNLLAVSPFYLAIEKGNQELINIMINRDEIFESIKESISSHAMDACLAHAAIKFNHFGILEALMKRLPFLIDSENVKGWKPLSYAASKGYIDQVRFLLTNFPDSINKVDMDGSMPIHKAIAGGHFLVVKEFITQSPQTLCDIDQKGRTTLHIATRYRKAEILSHLLKQEDVKKILNLQDKDGITFLDLKQELENNSGSGGKDGGNAGPSHSK